MGRNTKYHGKLNLSHPIFENLGSRALVLIMAGVTSEGTEEADYLRCLTYMRYSSVRIG